MEYANFFSFLNSRELYFFLMSFLLVVEVLLLFFLIKASRKRIPLSPANHSISLLVMTLVPYIITGICALAQAAYQARILAKNNFCYRIFHRIGWGFGTFIFIFLMLFIFELLKNYLPASKIFKISVLTIGSSFSIFYTVGGFLYPTTFFPGEFLLRTVIHCCKLAIVAYMTGTMLYAIYRIPQLPQILKQQLKIFTYFIIGPYLVAFGAQNPLTYFGVFVRQDYFLENFLTLFITLALYFAAKRLVHLRFLNFNSQVTLPPKRADFADDVAFILDEANNVKNIVELKYIAEKFFTRVLKIKERSAHFVLLEEDFSGLCDKSLLRAVVVKMLQEPFAEFAYKKKVLIIDELEFSLLNDPEPIVKEAVEFLHQIRADIVVPLFSHHEFIGFVVVDKSVRTNQFYTKAEQREMHVFATSIGPTINNLNRAKVERYAAELRKKEAENWELKQSLQQYRECMSSFFRMAYDNEVGLLTYKNKRFIVLNQDAQRALGCDPNRYKGHPMVRALNMLVDKAEKYKMVQKINITPAPQERYSIVVHPETDRGELVVSISRPQIGDLIRQQAHMLENPDHWNYALYLETTELGQTINAVFPGISPQLLNFKVALMRNMLNEQSLFIEGVRADIQQILGLLQITGRKKKLHEMLLREPEKEFQYIQKLCGMNKLFFIATGPEIKESAAEKPLLKALDKTGILYIENMHFLSSQTQKMLADYLTTGIFTPFKGEYQMLSEVRIVCSTTQEAQQKELIIPELLSVMKRNSISIPRLEELDDTTFIELVKGFAWQLVPSQKIHLLQSLFVDKDIKLMNKKQIEGFSDLRKRVESMLYAKSLQTNNALEDSGEPAPLQPEDKLMQDAVLLGKEALRDPELIKKLWEKFQNQTQIAKLIGVNRSSVCRRLQELNLVDHSETPLFISEKHTAQHVA